MPVLDQQSLGACTGFAAEGCVGSGSLFGAIPLSLAVRPTGDSLTDDEQAIALYSAATHLDDVDGIYPPTDSGSSGLAVAKACKAAGLISGYRHATSLNAALTALASQPVIAGINWYGSFDAPGPDGLISITSDAEVRGGHEICLDELDVENKLIGWTNSWGDSWGLNGRAYFTWDTFARLLKEDGDVTVFVPLSEPAPQPTPADCLEELAVALRQWWVGVEDWLHRHGL